MDTARSHTISHDSELGQWELVSGRPHPQLQTYVRSYEGYRERSTSFEQRLEVPSGDVAVIITFGSGYLVDGPDAEPDRERYSFVAGLHDRHALVRSAGPQYCVQIDFTPIGAHRFFGVPMRELRNRALPLDDVLGPEATRLTERLEAAGDWLRRFAILDEVIAARIERSTNVSPGVTWAWRQLEQSGGTSDIALLVDEIGCSRKHLISQFHEQVGMPPKKLARILRFNRALSLTAGDAPDWGIIAHQCGYYDQSHLIREFRHFCSLTPTAYRLRLLPDDSGVLGDDLDR